VTIALALSLLGCGWSLGRAPSAHPVVALGEVRALTIEGALREDLRRAIAAEVADRTRLGRGPLLSAEVLETEVRSVAPGGDLQEARLVVRFALEGAGAATVEGRRTFSLSQGDPVVTDEARRAAFTALSRELAAEAVSRLLSTPGGPS